VKTASGVVVVGIGDSGIETLNHIINNRLQGIGHIAINTYDAGLLTSTAGVNLLIGQEVTHGMGAGGRLEMGASAAESSYDEIKQALNGAKELYTVAGLGGGTGSGSTPVILRIAGEMNIKTTAVVSLPFAYEGTQRREVAERSLTQIKASAEYTIVVDNDDLLKFAPDLTIIENALHMAASVLAAKVVADLV